MNKRHFDLFDYAAQQRGGFNGSNPLVGEQVGQGVHFEGEFAERIIRGCAAGAKRVVLFPQGGDHIGQGLQRPRGLLLQRHRQQPPHEQFDEISANLDSSDQGCSQMKNAADEHAGQGDKQ